MTKIESALLILDELEIQEKILRSTLFTILEDKPAQGRNWNEAYNFSKKLGFVTENQDEIVISDLGKNILNRKKGEKNENEFSDYVFKECIFDNPEFIDVKQFLERFHEYENSLILEYDREEDPIIIVLLSELGIISFDKVWKIRNDIKNLVTINREHKGKRKLSQEDIDKIKTEQKRVGDCAEKLSLTFEKRYFEKEKMDITEIEHTSDSDDNAGYDIKSKWKKNRTKKMRESFIEVKGRKYDEDSFIISNNELNVAKMKGENFVIYFWKNLFEILESECENSTLEPTAVIRDPIKKLKINLCDNCLEYRIRLRDIKK